MRERVWVLLDTITATTSPFGEETHTPGYLAHKKHVSRDHLSEAATSDMSEAVPRQLQHHSVADTWHPTLRSLAAAVERIWHIQDSQG